MERKPVCVLAGDLHFNLQNLELASSALRMLLKTAKELRVPAVLNGDTLDQKAIVRGEVANRLIGILQEYAPENIYINCGNHDLLAEKGEESSLNFLRPYAQVLSRANAPTFIDRLDSWLVPYFNSAQLLKIWLETVPKDGARLIMHQGVQGADMGFYVKDSTSLPRETFANFRVVASHYHRRQDIKCGRPRNGAVGLFSYCGSPYSISFSEANDGPKGINILYDDGLLELVPTNLRKHIKLDFDLEGLDIFLRTGKSLDPKDLLWMVLRGPASELAKIKKKDLAEKVGVTSFKLDKIATETEQLDADEKEQARSGAEMLDALIDKTEEPATEKAGLKQLWRELIA